MRAWIFMTFLFIFSLSFAWAEVATQSASSRTPVYQYRETKDLVALVNEAAALVQKKGEVVFPEFKEQGSKWCHGETYVFVIDPQGKMILHPDPALEGKNEIDLKDVNGKLIIKGLLEAVSSSKGEGWFHYEWPEPGSLFPLWKSSFVKRVITPSGNQYIIGSGVYNMKMEKEFIVSVVDDAAALIEKEGEAAFAAFRDKSGPFIFMDVYIFVDRPDGVELVSGAFPNIEGRNLMDYKDSKGKYLVREYINVALTKGSGWVDYFWPKPQETAPSKKHTYVKKAVYGDEVFVVGSGAYLE